MIRRVTSLAVAAIVTFSSTVALADPHTWSAPSAEPTQSALEEGKALYVAGNRAVEQGRWADALTDFERAYALTGVPAALFNVATTLRALGRHVEARDAFTQLLAKHPKLDPDVKKQAEQMLAEEKARVASLVIADLPSTQPSLKIQVDGKVQKDDGTRPLPVDVDAGHHSLRVEDPKSKPFTWEGQFVDGEKKTVTVKLAPLDKAPPPPPNTETSSGSVFSSPWFWGAVGVVVVGGSIAGGYYYHHSRQLEPGTGTVVKL
ncbi:MAG: tetratricopeptide repeat protein [Polyangiales bacterium]